MKLAFLSEAKRYFDPIAADAKMAFEEGHEWGLRYQSAATSLWVGFGNGRTNELLVQVGRRVADAAPRPFSLDEILRLRAAPDATWAEGVTVQDQKALCETLRRLAVLTQTYASDFLNGEEDAYAQVAELRHAESIAYAREAAERVAGAGAAGSLARNSTRP